MSQGDGLGGYTTFSTSAISRSPSDGMLGRAGSHNSTGSASPVFSEYVRKQSSGDRDASAFALGTSAQSSSPSLQMMPPSSLPHPQHLHSSIPEHEEPGASPLGSDGGGGAVEIPATQTSPEDHEGADIF